MKVMENGVLEATKLISEVRKERSRYKRSYGFTDCKHFINR